MSKEQINLPTDGGTKEDRDQSSEDIKSLNRPKLPNMATRKITGYICEGSKANQCGARSTHAGSLCHPVPIYEGDEND